MEDLKKDLCRYQNLHQHLAVVLTKVEDQRQKPMIHLRFPRLVGRNQEMLLQRMDLEKG